MSVSKRIGLGAFAVAIVLAVVMLLPGVLLPAPASSRATCAGDSSALLIYCAQWSLRDDLGRDAFIHSGRGKHPYDGIQDKLGDAYNKLTETVPGRKPPKFADAWDKVDDASVRLASAQLDPNDPTAQDDRDYIQSLLSQAKNAICGEAAAAGQNLGSRCPASVSTTSTTLAETLAIIGTHDACSAADLDPSVVTTVDLICDAYEALIVLGPDAFKADGRGPNARNPQETALAKLDEALTKLDGRKIKLGDAWNKIDDAIARLNSATLNDDEADGPALFTIIVTLWNAKGAICDADPTLSECGGSGSVTLSGTLIEAQEQHLNPDCGATDLDPSVLPTVVEICDAYQKLIDLGPAAFKDEGRGPRAQNPQETALAKLDEALAKLAELKIKLGDAWSKIDDAVARLELATLSDEEADLLALATIIDTLRDAQGAICTADPTLTECGGSGSVTLLSSKLAGPEPTGDEASTDDGATDEGSTDDGSTIEPALPGNEPVESPTELLEPDPEDSPSGQTRVCTELPPKERAQCLMH